METENYVYKKEVDWSVLMEGFTLPLENQVVFLQNMGRFLQRGESKIIHFFISPANIFENISAPLTFRCEPSEYNLPLPRKRLSSL